MIYGTTINTTGKHICAECTKWDVGAYWSSASYVNHPKRNSKTEFLRVYILEEKN